ncbi:lysophospholipid acyltransferase family protein [Alteromonadaceae bacterium BrNp21-10]|nr:lysophospholipid acyltransferase family protein [Alteromonadaceae bacterium BrNp21-10]
MAFINKGWRLIATACCFFIFGFGGLLMTLFWFPLYPLFYRDLRQRKQASRVAVHYSFKGFIWLMCKLGVMQIKCVGLSKLRQLHGKIIIANHPSLIDVVVLISLIKNADCVVKQDLWQNVFIRGIIKATGYLSNADPEALISQCNESLEQGNNLIIFPEGTRTKPNGKLNFRRGAANLALRCNVNVQVILIQVTPSTLTKGQPWYQIPSKKFTFYLEVKDEFDVSPYNTGNISLSVRKLTRDVEQNFVQELNNELTS